MEKVRREYEEAFRLAVDEPTDESVGRLIKAFDRMDRIRAAIKARTAAE